MYSISGQRQSKTLRDLARCPSTVIVAYEAD